MEKMSANLMVHLMVSMKALQMVDSKVLGMARLMDDQMACVMESLKDWSLVGMMGFLTAHRSENEMGDQKATWMDLKLAHLRGQQTVDTMVPMTDSQTG